MSDAVLSQPVRSDRGATAAATVLDGADRPLPAVQVALVSVAMVAATVAALLAS